MAALFLAITVVYGDTLNLGSHSLPMFRLVAGGYLVLAILFHVALRNIRDFFNEQLTLHAFADGELLVKFKNAAKEPQIAQTNAFIGASLAETLGDLNWVRVKLPDGMSVEDAIERYRKSGEVEDVQPNFYYHLLATPNDRWPENFRYERSGEAPSGRSLAGVRSGQAQRTS